MRPLSAAALLCAAGVLAAPAWAVKSSAKFRLQAGAPLSAEDFQRIDAGIARAESLTKAAEKAAAAPPDADGGACPGGATASGMSMAARFARAPSTGPAAGLLTRIVIENASAWRRYNVCLAIALKNPKVCSRMATSAAPPGAEPRQPGREAEREDCETEAGQAAIFRAFDAQDPKLYDVCVAGLRGDTPEAVQKACRAVADYRGDAAAFVAAWSAARHKTPQEGQRALHELLGDEPCPTDKYDAMRDVCEERALWRKALKKGSSSACGGDGVCRVLMGEPAVACESYLGEMKKAACRQIYLPRFAAEQAYEFATTTDPLVAALSNAGHSNARGEAEVSRRLDAIFALRARMRAAAKVLQPPPIPQAAPAPVQ